ncbi:MAG: hypothetical protein FJ098_05635, partial [Deltaproteobacteria bacterium]|nr:hypothetical protein [Deltaproteobacteria bacterium]
MRSLSWMMGLWLVVAVLGGGCSNPPSNVTVDLGPATDASGDATSPDAWPDAGGDTIACDEDADCKYLEAGAPACRVPWCNPDTAACELAEAEDGVLCNDGDPCTQGDLCAAGLCTGEALA